MADEQIFLHKIVRKLYVYLRYQAFDIHTLVNSETYPQIAILTLLQFHIQPYFISTLIQHSCMTLKQCCFNFEIPAGIWNRRYKYEIPLKTILKVKYIFKY